MTLHNYKGPTVADLIPDINAKIEQSRLAIFETQRAMQTVYNCPVPKDCNGPHLEYDNGLWTSYSGSTYGTSPCRFHNLDCPLERKRTADRLKRAEQAQKASK
jgi:hypothetical protein